jgi:hypothetical protein
VDPFGVNFLILVIVSSGFLFSMFVVLWDHRHLVTDHLLIWKITLTWRLLNLAQGVRGGGIEALLGLLFGVASTPPMTRDKRMAKGVEKSFHTMFPTKLKVGVDVLEEIVLENLKWV